MKVTIHYVIYTLNSRKLDYIKSFKIASQRLYGFHLIQHVGLHVVSFLVFINGILDV